MTFKPLLFLGLLFTTGLINAQTDFRPGYIVQLNSDTLNGEIDYRGDLLMGEKCRFRENETKPEVIFSPNEILAYRFEDSKYFISKELRGKKVFMEFLIKGKINIYYLRDGNGDHYFLEKEGTGLVEIPYEEGIKYKNDKQYAYKSKKHIGILNYSMQDAPDFQSRIAKMRKPGHDNLIKLAEDYHNTVCKDGECIIYVKKEHGLKLNIEIVGGLANYRNTGYDNIKNYFQAGILTHLWMPGTSEKLFFRSGILFSAFEADKSKTLLKIPVQVEYVYPKGVVKPKIALGINVYKPLYQSVALMGGINIKVRKSVYCSINYDIDFNPNDKFPLAPKTILSQSVSAGLLINL